MLSHDSSSPSALDWAQLRQTFAQLGEGVSIFDADLRLVMCNESAIDLSGMPAETVKPGTHLHDFLVAQARLGEFVHVTPWRRQTDALPS